MVRNPLVSLSLGLVLLGACTDAPTPPPTGAAVTGPVGLQGVTPPLNGQLGVIIDNAHGQTLANLLDHTVNMGVGWVKYTIRWPQIQPTGPSYDAGVVADTRAMVAAARTRGLKVFILIDGAPGWTRRCGEPGQMYETLPDCEHAWQYPPDDYMYHHAQQFAASLVTDHFDAFPYDVQAWSILNEVNSADFFRVLPGRDPVTEYGRLFAHMAVELRSRGQFVVAPELAQGGAHGYFDFLARFLAAHQHQLDAVGVHQYNTANGTASDMATFRDTIARYAPGKQLWLSETGANSHGATGETAQTHHLAGQLHEMENGTSGWDRTFYFRLQGPIGPDYPYSWLVDAPSNLPRQKPYNCMKWYGKDRSLGLPRPLDCMRHSAY